MAAVPRVRPRARMEDMVDVVAHPPRKKLRTVEAVEGTATFHWTTIVAIVALAIFWISAGPAAALAAAGNPVGWGLAALSMSSLVVAYWMGAA